MSDDGIRYHCGNPLLISLDVPADVNTVDQVTDYVRGIMETLSAIGADVPVIRDHPPIQWEHGRSIERVVAAHYVAPDVIRMVVAGQHADVVYALRVMLMWLATRPR